MEINVAKREILGKKVDALRKEGLVPAEVYGHGFENIHLSVSAKDFTKIFKEVGESTIINLIFESKRMPVLIQEVTFDAVSDQILSIDFRYIRTDEKLRVAIALNFIGEAPAVKESGGVLIKAVHEIEVESLPADLPHNIEVDLSQIENIGDSIHIKDLKVGQGVKILVDSETVVATVTEPAKEEEVAPISVEDVKVEEEKKEETVEK